MEQIIIFPHSGNQTWQWKIHYLYIGDFPIETSISSGSRIATFDYRRVYPICQRPPEISRKSTPSILASKVANTLGKTMGSTQRSQGKMQKPLVFRQFGGFLSHYRWMVNGQSQTDEQGYPYDLGNLHFDQFCAFFPWFSAVLGQVYLLFIWQFWGVTIWFCDHQRLITEVNIVTCSLKKR